MRLDLREMLSLAKTAKHGPQGSSPHVVQQYNTAIFSPQVVELGSKTLADREVSR